MSAYHHRKKMLENGCPECGAEMTGSAGTTASCTECNLIY